MKCPSCEAEWQTGKSASVLATCPFCGASLAPQKKEEPAASDTIQGVLRALVQERGVALYKKENAGQLKALLSDLAAEFPRERKVLGVVLTEGVQERLLKADGGTDYEKHDAAAWCRMHLTEELGMMEDRATEAVNILAAGLGWEPPLAEVAAPASTPAQSATPQTVASATSAQTSAVPAVPQPGVHYNPDKTVLEEVDDGVINLTVLDSVIEIGKSACSGCDDLESIILPQGLKKIGNSAFQQCSSLESVEIPAGVEKIGNFAFLFCDSLESVVIQEGVSEIGNSAFLGCSSLESVEIPASIKKIGNDAFGSCNSIKEIRFGGTKAQWRAVKLIDGWASGIRSLVVRCTDGTLE